MVSMLRKMKFLGGSKSNGLCHLKDKKYNKNRHQAFTTYSIEIWYHRCGHADNILNSLIRSSNITCNKSSSQCIHCLHNNLKRLSFNDIIDYSKTPLEVLRDVCHPSPIISTNGHIYNDF